MGLDTSYHIGIDVSVLMVHIGFIGAQIHKGEVLFFSTVYTETTLLSIQEQGKHTKGSPKGRRKDWQ